MIEQFSQVFLIAASYLVVAGTSATGGATKTTSLAMAARSYRTRLSEVRICQL